METLVHQEERKQGLPLLDSATIAALPEVRLPLVDATPENLAPFGLYLGSEVPESGLSIPFYKGSVQEGHNFSFQYRGQAVMRSAKIGRRNPQLDWLERHLHMTQLFVPLGTRGYVMVLAPPNQDEGHDVPDLSRAVAFRFPAGAGLMLHKGTWHDFPFATEGEVTVLTANSSEVVEALKNCPSPQELFDGDVYKINVPARLGVRLIVELPGQD